MNRDQQSASDRQELGTPKVRSARPGEPMALGEYCLSTGVRPSVGVTILTLAAIATLTAVTVIGRRDADDGTALLVLDIAVGVISCALVAVVFFRPVTGALPLAALAAISPAATTSATVGTLQVARRRPFKTALAVAAAGIAGHAVQGLWRPTNGISYRWYLLLDIAVHAALLGLGALTQARQAILDSLRERAIRAEAEQGRRIAEARALERTRMAREMHDVLAHRLSLLATYAGALEYRPDSSPEQLSRAAGVVRSGVHQALDELREVISVLRDSDIEERPGGRPQPTFKDLRDLVDESRAAGTHVQYDETVAEADSLPPATGRTAYRVVQEGLTNARKHAAGQPVSVRLAGRPGDDLRIDISNPATPNGVPVAPGSGTGLVGLTERVQLAGGRLDHGRGATETFRLHASLPWPA